MIRDRVLAGYLLATVGLALQGVTLALPPRAFMDVPVPVPSLVSSLTVLLPVAGLALVSVGRGPGFNPRERWGWWLLVGAVVAQFVLLFLLAGVGNGDHRIEETLLLPTVLAWDLGLVLLLGLDLRTRERHVPHAAFAAGALAALYGVVLAMLRYHGDPFYLTFQRFFETLSVTLFAIAAALAAYHRVNETESTSGPEPLQPPGETPERHGPGP